MIQHARQTTALAPWFGSNRTNAYRVGDELEGCEHVSVLFAGGMCELPYITARSIVVNDKHHLMINLSRIAACPRRGARMYRVLRRLAFHPETLDCARDVCAHGAETEFRYLAGMDDDDSDTVSAAAYFVCCWMNRSAKAGTKDEFRGAIPIRFNANGGASAVRYQSAIRGILDFRKAFARCEFLCEDAFQLAEGRLNDAPRHGIYADSPWVDDGARYLHSFKEADHVRLAEILGGFEHARVVIRYGDHPLIRKLYPADRWKWIEFDGRTQANEAKREVLITNGK